jgi:hypothetical protein
MIKCGKVLRLVLMSPVMSTSGVECGLLRDPELCLQVDGLQLDQVVVQ